MSLPRVLPTLAAALCLTLAGAAPTTAPARVDPVVSRWFAQLADADPAARAAAREQLMGLSPDGLDRLLDVVRAAGGAVSPAQAEPLHDIVCHVFLAGEHYVAAGDPDDPRPLKDQLPRNVMGIRWPSEMVDTPRLGVPVVERWPGFPARRLLQDGDMILGVFVRPDLPLGHLPNEPTHSPVDLRQVLGKTAADQRQVVLAVLRDGREVQVRMTLVPQPVDASGSENAGPAVADAFVRERQQRAEAYWQSHFAPALAGSDDPDAEPPSVALDP